MIRRKKTGETKRANVGWEVKVSPEVRRYSHNTIYYDHHSDRVIEDCVAVRLIFDGKPHMTFGTVSITCSDFEDRVTTMKAEALEKAAALNAVGCRS